MLPVVLFASLFATAHAWLPGLDKTITTSNGTNLFNSTSNSNVTARSLPSNASGKIRGVSMGSLFVFEPWIASVEWANMGCSGMKSEFDCVSKLGQTQANKVFQNHWNTWITQDDITQIKNAGLNTIRVPVGYWMLESLVYSDSEHFPQGGVTYLDRLCGWASDAGIYVIMDLHGLPGAQTANNSFTGQYATTAGFYQTYQYTRALTFLTWITNRIHSNNNYRTVGMLEIVNEPIQNAATVATMRSLYYPQAYAAIRAAETALGIPSSNLLHIQMMNKLWGSGDPNQYLTNTNFAAYDDHRYIKWDSSVAVTKDAYLSTSCKDNRGGNSPTIVGEFSISVPDDVQWTDDWHPTKQTAFYKKWMAAQIMAYETTAIGWVFWTWKAQLGDYRWSYQDAITSKVVPATNIDDVYNYGAC